MDLPQSTDSNKKINLEDLSKEELIKKCTLLLQLAQKAKQSKVSLQEENDKLKIELKNISVSECSSHLELIENLTHQKLALVTANEEFQTKTGKVLNELELLKAELKEYQERLTVCDNENVSYKRQIDRLTDENEQLLTDLDSLEKQLEKLKLIAATQQQQLLELEKSKSEETENATTELQRMLSISLEEVKKMKIENNELSDKVNNLELNLAQKDNNILIIKEELVNAKDLITKYTQELNEYQQSKESVGNCNDENSKINGDRLAELENSNSKLKEKIKFYHSKIVKFASIAKDLRTSKNEILILSKSYIEQVKEWKEQLNCSEKNIVKYMNSMEQENKTLKEKLKQAETVLDTNNLEDQKQKLLDQLETQKNNYEAIITNLKTAKEHFEQEYNLIEEKYQRNQLTYENELKIVKDQFESEKNHYENELKIVKDQLEAEKSQYENELKIVKDQLEAEKSQYENELKIVKDQFESEKNHYENEIKIIKDQFESEKSQYENELKIYKQDIKILITENQELKQTHTDSLVEEKQKLENEINNIKNQYEQERLVLNNKIEELINKKNEALIRSEEQLKKTETKLSELEKIIKGQENEIKLLRKENITISKIKDDLVCELEKLNSQKKELKEKTEKMLECSNSLTDLQNKVKSLQELELRSSEEIKNLAGENKTLSLENELLQEKLQKFEYSLQNRIHISSQTNEVPCNVELFEEQISNLKRENAELLVEMNEMNQVLKERGENISKLEAHCEEVLKKLQIYETQANKNINNITEKEKIIENLTTEIQQLKSNPNDNNLSEVALYKNEIQTLKTEIENMRDKLNSNLDSSYVDDGMSTSTISRTEEMNRLKDLEGSWEERYGKLRNLAVKLKGKVRELTQNLTQQQSENEEIKKKLASNVKTIQTIQTRCDSLQDELDNSEKQCKQLQNQLSGAANDISRDKQSLANTEEVITGLRIELENLKKDKMATENWKKQVSAKIQTLRKEIEANNSVKKDFESKIATLNSTLEAKELALRTEIENHKQTKNLLEQSISDRKKNSVLNLEMQDYERGAKESTKKIEKQQEEISHLKNQIDIEKSTINALREQNKLLEERILSEEQASITLTSEISNYKKQITKLEKDIFEKAEKIHSLTQQLETSRAETEELSTELSKAISKHQATNQMLKSERDKLSNENLRLQQILRESQDELKLKKDELKVIQTEYDGYKVRAQSVLRQNQSRDVGLEEKLSEEVASLVAQNLSLNNQLDDAKNNLEILKKTNNKLTTEIREQVQKIQELEDDCEDIKNQFADLSAKYEKTVIENAETIRNMKVQTDTLSQCYRQQLSDQETRHNREILELQSRLEKAPTPTETSPVLPYMPRGEGEGSESIESNNSVNVHPVPLERLLGTDSEQEMERIRKKLQEHESKVAHLTSLLSDTEQDLVKHVQMNKHLKEEIRRQQRSEEREKHAENLEYLKNVIFKFVTLNSGDERKRLVPVLNEILKLSPDEIKQLIAVADGSSAVLKGWSSYLPAWSSPNKPQ